MEFSMIFIVSNIMLLFSSSFGKIASHPFLSPTPALAPTLDFLNLTELLSVVGPFHTFLGYLESTKVIDTFQNQANNIEEGITIFVPKDNDFNAIKKTTLSNLTSNRLKQVILFHALPHFYSLTEFIISPRPWVVGKDVNVKKEEEIKDTNNSSSEAGTIENPTTSEDVKDNKRLRAIGVNTVGLQRMGLKENALFDSLAKLSHAATIVEAMPCHSAMALGKNSSMRDSTMKALIPFLSLYRLETLAEQSEEKLGESWETVKDVAITVGLHT
ncbi:Fasciclin-like arabinogalactan protein 7 [Glycine soja]